MAKKRRTALVNGAGRNIGRAIVLALAGDGFNVVVNGSSDEAAIEAVAADARALGVEAMSVLGDVGVREDANRLAARALEHFGAVDVLVKEFGAQGITANIVSPGPIRPDDADPETMARLQSTVSRVPAGRLGEPDEVAAAVSMLVSAAGAHVNGQMIQVNGGGET